MNAIQQTHWDGCWQERSHHQCAVRLIAELNDCAEEAGYNREALKKAYAEIKKLRAQPVQPAEREDLYDIANDAFDDHYDGLMDGVAASAALRHVVDCVLANIKQPVQPSLTTNSAQISSGLVVDPEYSEDLPNPLAKARDDFMLSREACYLCDPTSIGAPAHCGLYLQDRIEAAFVAGWNACEQENNRDAE